MTEFINSIVKNRKNALVYIIPPFIVMAIMMVMFFLSGMYPFGNKSLAWCDMRQQVLPLMLDFKDILSGNGNLIFSWQNAGGMNFLGVFLFFISSPFTFLVALVEKSEMLLFMNILTMLKMMTCSITAVVYFKNCHKKLSTYFTIILGVIYAFSGYAMLFYQNTIWLDIMYMFPLLLFSYETLIRKRKIGGFIACLTIMVLMNYYLSYMIVVFTLLYFGYYTFKNRKNLDQGIPTLFFGACGISALLSAVVWLPSFAQYLSSARGTNVIEGLFNSPITTQIYTVFPLIFATAIIVPAIIVFNRNTNKKNTKFYMVLFILTLIPVFLEPVNLMWHTGNYMSFPCRYGYITVFMALVVIAYKFGKINKKHHSGKSSIKFAVISIILAIIFAIGSVIFYKLTEESIAKYTSTLWGNLTSFLLIAGFTVTAICIYSFFFYIFRIKKISYKFFSVLLAIMVLSECVFNVNVYITSAAYSDRIYKVSMDLSDKIHDDDFYRIKAEKKYFDANLIGAMGYNSLSHYTSLTSQDYMFTMKKFGYSSYWMEVGANGGTLFTDALLSAKYNITKYPTPASVYENSFFTIEKAENYLPLGVITSADMAKEEQLPAMQRIELQQYMAETLFGLNDNMFKQYNITELNSVIYKYIDNRHYFSKPAKLENNSIIYEIDVEEKQTLYFDCFDKCSNALREPINDSFAVYVNGIFADTSYPNKDTNGLLSLGTYSNEHVTVLVDLKKNVSCASFGVYGLKHDVLGELTSNAKTADLDASGTNISGSFYAEEGEYLYISVPYEEGFTATINGEKTEVLKAFSGFSAIKLKAGENNLQMEFTPKGLKLGIVISIIGVIALGIYCFFRKKIFKIFSHTDKICKIGIYVLFAGVLFAVYIAPLVISIIGNCFKLVN